MSKVLQNFYKSTLSLDWTIGTGNFYVAVKPTVSTGWLVISPNNTTLREIVKYSATGTDANGDYITVSNRGVGGTSEQIHALGEPIRMNITAEYWAEMTNDIASIVAAGVPNANTTTFGGVEEATAAEIDARTQVGGTGAELFINPKLLHDAHNIPTVAPGAVGNSLFSNGLDWVSSPAIPPFIAQQIAFATGSTSNSNFQVTSNADGSVLFVSMLTSGAILIYRYIKDAGSLNYRQTHGTSISLGGTQSHGGLAIIGNFLYVSYVNAGVTSLSRFAIADLSGVTTMSFSGTAAKGTSFSDGTDLYIFYGSGTAYRFTISGTTATNAGSITYTTAGTVLGAISDGTNMWCTDSNATGTVNIRKYPKAGGAATSTTTWTEFANAYPGGVGLQLFMGSAYLLGYSWFSTIESNTAITGQSLNLKAISLP